MPSAASLYKGIFYESIIYSISKPDSKLSPDLVAPTADVPALVKSTDRTWSWVLDWDLLAGQRVHGDGDTGCCANDLRGWPRPPGGMAQFWQPREPPKRLLLPDCCGCCWPIIPPLMIAEKREERPDGS